MKCMPLIVNTADFQAKCRVIASRVAMAAPLAVEAAGELIERNTQPDVPIDKGVLRGSGYTLTTGMSGYIAMCSVIYSAYAEHNGYNYAWKQHEFNFNHPKGGKDHYLSDTVVTYMGQSIEIMAKTMSMVL